ncbi:MAG: nucleoside hydrolase [Eubacteriales bacterium]
MSDLNAELITRLQKPKGKIDVVMDTDTFNEIDDQYALAYLIRSDEKLNIQAIYAAPFHNVKSSGPADGMEKSYGEILNILDLLGRVDLKPFVFRGSKAYLLNETTPVISEAAEDLAKRAMAYSPEKPLYIVSIGAITNIASAILINPEIINKIVIVWLGGHSFEWPNTAEFNMFQDVAAARVIFGCQAAVVQLPCMGVVSAFTTTGPELEFWLLGKNRLCDYLVDITTKEANSYNDGCWSRVIWDVTAVAWLLDDDFTADTFKHSPIPQFDHHYSFDNTRHFIKYVYHINRDALLQDLFEKLAK